MAARYGVGSSLETDVSVNRRVVLPTRSLRTCLWASSPAERYAGGMRLGRGAVRRRDSCRWPIPTARRRSSIAWLTCRSKSRRRRRRPGGSAASVTTGTREVRRPKSVAWGFRHAGGRWHAWMIPHSVYRREFRASWWYAEFSVEKPGGGGGGGRERPCSLDMEVDADARHDSRRSGNRGANRAYGGIERIVDGIVRFLENAGTTSARSRRRGGNAMPTSFIPRQRGRSRASPPCASSLDALGRRWAPSSRTSFTAFHGSPISRRRCVARSRSS